MYKTVEKIEVSAWNEKVGAVVLDPLSGYYVFAYYPQFIKLGIELAPIQMPMSSSPYVFAYLPERTFMRLPALLADALPDDFGNNLIDAWMAKKGVRKEDVTPLTDWRIWAREAWALLNLSHHDHTLLFQALQHSRCRALLRPLASQ